MTECRLVRSKLLTILKPTVRCFITQQASGSLQGALESYNDIIKHLLEHKKETALINSYSMKSKAAGKGKGKPGTQGAPLGSATGSKRKGIGKNPKGKPNIAANNNKPVTATKKKEDDTASDKTQP